MNVFKYVISIFDRVSSLSALEATKRKSFAMYFAISGLLGTLSSLAKIGQVDFSNPLNIIIIIFMPLSLVALSPLAITHNSNKLCIALLCYCYVVLCANNYTDAGAGLDTTIFGLILVVMATLYFGITGMVISSLGYVIQNMLVPEAIKILNPQTAAVYDDLYYVNAVFDIITCIVVALCVLVFRNELMNASTQLENEKIRSETAERAKSNFLANMSHEIRTPMNGIVGMTALLGKTPLNEKQKMFADIITKSGNSLLTIINDILDFSKLDAGRVELELDPFNIQVAIEDVTALFASTIAEKDIDIIVRVSPNTPQLLFGDVGRIRQIIMNLVGNAVKFTEQGHVYINVECVDAKPNINDRQSTKNENVKLRISVEDTGIGISKQKISHIFSKFSQVDESASRKHEGTGLGLAISSQLIELMDGRISVESEEGKGSCFAFEIEFLTVDGLKSEPKIPTHLEGSRLLVVEKNALISSIRVERFQTWNLDSASVSSGQECIDCLRQMEAQNVLPDLIVLSCQLDDMDGLAVVSKIRQSARVSEIPILMLTKVDDLEENKEYSDLNIEANLLKPWHTSVLLETVLALLDQASSKAIIDKVSQNTTSSGVDQKNLESEAV